MLILKSHGLKLCFPVLIMVCLTLISQSSIRAQTNNNGFTPLKIFENNSEKPLDIEADSIVISENQGAATITGNVIISQDKSQLRSERVVIHYEGQLLEQNSTRQPSKMEVFDGLTLDTFEGSVTAESMVYDFSTGLAELNRNVVLIQKGNRSQGELLIIDTNKGTVKMSGGKKGRVKTTINLGQ